MLQKENYKETNLMLKKEQTQDVPVKTKFFKDNNSDQLRQLDAILIPNENANKRFTLFPIKYHDMWEMYEKSLNSFWVAKELNLTSDVDDWNNKLNDQERFYLEHILAFFSQADGIVNENLLERFQQEIHVNEAKFFYQLQACMENVHAEVYAIFIDTYIPDPARREFLFNAIENIPCVKKKADWALRWISNEKASFGERLLAFACVEGIFFSGSFAAIFWLKKRNLLKGLGQANTLISRDEGMHMDFACLLYKKYLSYSKPTPERAYQIVREACELEKEFQTESLPVSLIGMNKELMCRYIEYVSDYLLLKIGLNKSYNVANPFDFMENISLDTCVNFFEDKNNDYQIGLSEKTFSLDEDV